MRKKAITLGIASLAVLGVAAYALQVSAYRGDPNQKGPNYSPERHADMQEAFQKNDYEAWKKLMQGKGRVSEVVNSENFHRFSEMRQLMLEGKKEEAQKIRQELGLGQKNGKGNGHRGQGRKGNFSDANRDGVCDRAE